MVYSGSTTTGGQPLLSPQPIIDALTQLDAIIHKLEQAIKDTMQDVEQKKRVSFIYHLLQIFESLLFCEKGSQT